MKLKFKPTLSKEMDLMKSILEDFEKLSFLISHPDMAEQFWLNQDNQEIWKILNNQFEKFSSKWNIDVPKFYDTVFVEIQNSIQNFDVKEYEDNYELDFNFHETCIDYQNYFRCKRIYELMNDLPGKFERDYDNQNVILKEIELIKSEYLKLVTSFKNINKMFNEIDTLT